MIECVLAWIMLFWGLCSGNPLYLIACGVFAVASHIYRIREEIKKNGNN